MPLRGIEPLSMASKATTPRPQTPMRATYTYLCPQEGSNLHQRVRSPLLYPLSYEGKGKYGVALRAGVHYPPEADQPRAEATGASNFTPLRILGHVQMLAVLYRRGS